MTTTYTNTMESDQTSSTTPPHTKENQQSRISQMDALDNLPPPPSTSGNVDESLEKSIEAGGSNNSNSNENNNLGSSPTPSPSEPVLPLEYQLHEVDLTSPDLDPLEYTFRRLVPIPKVYFWETADQSNNHHESLPFKIKLWHNTIYYLSLCLKKAEAGGEIIANIFGLNNSEFDYVMNAMTEEEWRMSRENVERRLEESRANREKREGEEEIVRDVGLSSREFL
mmetsp:Transcript_22697/g.46746  ORF Transcript_22697/g.46746 Transcript_22697/m.46746 type:complete len:225 (-) Transcript_22697:185-859(-)